MKIQEALKELYSKRDEGKRDATAWEARAVQSEARAVQSEARAVQCEEDVRHHRLAAQAWKDEAEMWKKSTYNNNQSAKAWQREAEQLCVQLHGRNMYQN